jgi:hypothetical protein
MAKVGASKLTDCAAVFRAILPPRLANAHLHPLNKQNYGSPNYGCLRNAAVIDVSQTLLDLVM